MRALGTDHVISEPIRALGTDPLISEPIRALGTDHMISGTMRALQIISIGRDNINTYNIPNNDGHCDY